MKQRIFQCLFVVVVAMQTGCTTTDKVVQTWVGHSIDDLTARWGAPSSAIRRNDGGATYTYVTYDSEGSACRKSLTTDNRSIIVSTSTSGCGWQFK